MAGLTLTPRKGTADEEHETGPQREEASSSTPHDEKAGPATATLPLRKRKFTKKTHWTQAYHIVYKKGGIKVEKR